MEGGREIPAMVAGSKVQVELRNGHECLRDTCGICFIYGPGDSFEEWSVLL